MAIKKIISGGQAGVDQAALLVATELGILIGGWCPLGGLDEHGFSIFEKYPLRAVAGLDFVESVTERKKRNIQDSDGTLIIVPPGSGIEAIPDGTVLTVEYAIEQRKPYLIVPFSSKTDISQISLWIKENSIKTLNVAGPRESSFPGIYDSACKLFFDLFPQLKSTCIEERPSDSTSLGF